MNLQLVFIGYHRSGTSAITQHFAEADLFVGNNLLGANPSNPYGHFEDLEFLAINRSILDSNSTDWQTKTNVTAVIKNEAYDLASNLIAKRDTLFNIWGFKDPRTCLLLDFWHSLLSNPKYIVCLRHYSFCIDSIMRRTLRDYYTIEEDDVAEKIKLDLFNYDAICANWCVYMSSLLSFLKGREQDFIIINMDMLDENLSFTELSNKKFGTDLEPIKLSKTFNSKLFKSKIHAEQNINPKLLRIANNLWNQLLSIV